MGASRRASLTAVRTGDAILVVINADDDSVAAGKVCRHGCPPSSFGSWPPGSFNTLTVSQQS